MTKLEKQHRVVATLDPSGLGLGEGVDPTRARLLAHVGALGTTTRLRDCAVLWIGEHLGLVLFKGSKGWSGRGEQSYYLTTVRLVDFESRTRGREVPDSSTQAHEVRRVREGHLWSSGLLTKDKLAALIERARVEDAAWLEKQKAIREENAAREREHRANVEAAEERTRIARAKVEEARALAQELVSDAPMTHGDYELTVARLARLVLEVLS